MWSDFLNRSLARFPRENFGSRAAHERRHEPQRTNLISQPVEHRLPTETSEVRFVHLDKNCAAILHHRRVGGLSEQRAALSGELVESREARILLHHRLGDRHRALSLIHI